MDFLNKVTAKAGETFQSIKESDVTKKAINYAEIPGLQMQISKAEGNIKKAYEEIGCMYYEKHKDKATDEFAVLFATISENLNKIGELKAEVEEKKKGSEAVAETTCKEVEKICPICGRSVEENVVFCSVCGHKF